MHVFVSSVRGEETWSTFNESVSELPELPKDPALFLVWRRGAHFLPVVHKCDGDLWDRHQGVAILQVLAVRGMDIDDLVARHVRYEFGPRGRADADKISLVFRGGEGEGK